MPVQHLSVEEVAVLTGLPATIIRRYAEVGLITPSPDYTEVELRELRRVRRLVDDLGLNHEAIEILLRMRQRILVLEQELRQLRAELRARRAPGHIESWIEAVWRDLP